MMTKLEIGLAIVLALIIAGGAIYLSGHHAGAKAETAKVAVQQAKTIAKHSKATGYVKSHIDSLQVVPDPAPSGSVVRAVPGSALDELQNSWSRPE